MTAKERQKGSLETSLLDIDTEVGVLAGWVAVVVLVIVVVGSRCVSDDDGDGRMMW